MAEEENKDKKGPNVYSPNLDASPEVKIITSRVLGNYIDDKEDDITSKKIKQ